jgi:hypothetical protein
VRGKNLFVSAADKLGTATGVPAAAPLNGLMLATSTLITCPVFEFAVPRVGHPDRAWRSRTGGEGGNCLGNFARAPLGIE